jgi:hypothetical protein
VAHLRVCADKSHNCRFHQTVSFCWSTIIGLLLAFAPKCPLCWGVYVSVCGAGGLNVLPYQRWMAPVLALLLVLNLGALLHHAQMRKVYGPFLLNLLGAIAIAAGIALGIPGGTFLGISLVLIGSARGVYGALQSRLGRCCQRNNSLNGNSTTNNKQRATLGGTSKTNFRSISV